MVITVDPMHDETWRQRILAGRTDELPNLEAAIENALKRTRARLARAWPGLYDYEIGHRLSAAKNA